MKEQFDEHVIDSAFKKIVESKTEYLQTHFVYAGQYYYFQHARKLKSFILKGMKKYNIKIVLVTVIFMRRFSLITKERMENICIGKETVRQKSVNDDLESLFQDLQLGNKPDNKVLTYFLPKLTKEELKLVEGHDSKYFNTFFATFPDVNEDEMKASDSDSKYVLAFCERETYTIENPSLENN